MKRASSKDKAAHNMRAIESRNRLDTPYAGILTRQRDEETGKEKRREQR